MAQAVSRTPFPIPEGTPGSIRNEAVKFERHLRMQGYPESDITWMMTGFIERAYAKRDQQVRQVTRESQEFQSRGFPQKVLGTATAAAANLVNTTTFGRFPALAGLVGGEEARRRAEIGLAASQEVNPIASTVGSLGGFFVGPAGAAARGGAALATRGTARLGGAAMRGLERAAPEAAATARSAALLGREAAQGSQMGAFALRAAGQIGKNFAGGAGAISTFELAKQREDDATLGMRLSDTLDVVTSPTNLALTAGVGVAAAKLARPISTELRGAIQRFERITGQQVPVDVYTDWAAYRAWFDAVSKLPTVRGAVEQVQRNMTKALLASINEIAQRQPSGRVGAAGRVGRERIRGRASAGVRRVAGQGRREGAVTRARRGMESAALEAEGANQMTPEAVTAMRNGLAVIIRERRARGNESPEEFQQVVNRMLKLTRRLSSSSAERRAPTLYELESMRKQTSQIGYINPNMQSRARREAALFYDVLDQAILSTGPSYHKALKVGERLQRMEEALPRVARGELDDVVMQRFWQGRGIKNRLAAMQEHGRPEDFQAAKGWLFHSLIEEAVNPRTGHVTEAKLEQLFRRKGGIYNSQIFDRVLPGVRREIIFHARVSDAMRKKGVLGPEGSQTAGRQPLLNAITGSSIGAAAFIATMFSNHFFEATIATLGGAGVGVVINRAIKSTIRGAGQDMLQNLARGTARPISRLPTALSQSETAQGVGDTAASITRALSGVNPQ